MKKLTIALLCLGMMAGVSLAGTEAGDTELSVSLTATKPKDGDTSVTAFFLIGKFLTSAVQLSGVGIFSTTDGDITGFVGAGLDLHLIPSASIVPYVGASATTDIGDNSSGDIYGDVHGGFKFFVGENTSINASVHYQALVEEFQDDYTLQGRVGISVYL